MTIGGIGRDEKGARAINPLAEWVRRVMVRTGDGRLRPIWRATYRAVARGVSAYLRAGRRGASVYAIGSLGGPDAVYGISDIDLTIVVPTEPGRPGEARDAVNRRWERLCRMALSLRQLVFVAVYEEHELRRAANGSPCLRSARGTSGARAAQPLFRPGPFVDPAEVASRPILEPPASAWRLLAGQRRLPATREPDAHQRGMIAWLELQHWWRYAFGVAARPDGPRTAYLCVKLASEPARIWLWLVHGERVSSRRQALARGGEVLPEERPFFERALALYGALAQSPNPPLVEMLEGFFRLTRRIADRLAAEVEAAGVQEVRLTWGQDELVLAPSALDPLDALLGARPRLLPLVDWRALVWPSAPDEAFVPVPGHPTDLATLGTAAVAGRAGPYAALRDGDLLVLPAPLKRRTLLRAVQSPVTDPLSFALLDGAPVARVSRAPGWSIHDTAIRATAEHRAWLEAGGAIGDATIDALGLLFTAARAGLLLERLESGQPELALTVAAVAESLGASGRVARSVADSSYEAYRACRPGGSPLTSVMTDLRKCVMAMPAYRDPAPVVAWA